MTDHTATTNDVHIRRALTSGAITVDTEQGLIYDEDGSLRPTYRTNGYLVCSLPYGPQVRVHRVVWIAKHGSIPPGQEINHRNSLRDDNRLWNLEAITHRENMAHMTRSPYYKGWLDSDVMNADPEFLLRLIHADEEMLKDPDAEEKRLDGAPSHRVYFRSWRQHPIPDPIGRSVSEEHNYEAMIKRHSDVPDPADPEETPDPLTEEPIARPPKRARRRRT